MKVRVVRRMLLSNVTEDITSFPLSQAVSTIGILEGYNVLKVNPPGKASDPASPQVEPLCDLRQLAITDRPHGLTFIQSENLFAVNGSSQMRKLFLFDQAGRPRGTRDIELTPDFKLNHLEGLAYVPQKAPHYPDHIVMIANILHPDGTAESRLHIIDRNGQLTAHIFAIKEFLTGVAYRAPDRLLVTSANNETIWEIDFQGNIIKQRISPPAIFGGAFPEIEGLVQARGNAVAAVSFYQGRLVYLDGSLNPVASLSVDYRIGLGAFEIGALAWDAARSRHLIISLLRDPVPPLKEPSPKRHISAVSATLDAVRPITIVDDDTVRMTYLPAERLIAVTHQENDPATPTTNRQTILLYNELGKMVETLDVTKIGHPSGIAYVPATQQFVVRFAETKTMLTVLTRKGEFVRNIVLEANVPKFSGFAFFDPAHQSGGRFVFLNTNDGGLITDFNGQPQGTFVQRDLVIASSNISAITTGPDAGAFAILDGGNNELVIFRLIETA